MPRDNLTGKTGDVNPQWMRGYCNTSGASNVNASNVVRLPIQRLPSGRKCQVIEVLKVQYITDGAAASKHWAMGITTQDPSTAVNFLDPAAVHSMRTPADGESPQTYMFDLTDGAGHGVLVATDNIYLWAAISEAVVHQVDFAILYRFKNVTMSEYVGIAQSQMNLA